MDENTRAVVASNLTIATGSEQNSLSPTLRELVWDTYRDFYKRLGAGADSDESKGSQGTNSST